MLLLLIKLKMVNELLQLLMEWFTLDMKWMQIGYIRDTERLLFGYYKATIGLLKVH